jgi:Predicted pyridoxal phosphate-dependent enzyme apparently involved in regulation of cell wall biogenesis
MQDIIKPTQPVMPDYYAYIEEIKDIWDTKALTNNGPKVRKLKKGIQEYMNCKNADLFVNGHSALMIAIKALDLQGEVLTSPFTFVSTSNAIVQNGLVPVFCDIDDSYNIDVKKMEEHITEKTSAIITPHIFGIPCDVKGIERIASKHRLKVIYDGAQAFGSRIAGEHIGRYGDITMFSLHAIKVYNSIEGGLLTYADDALHEQFELYRNFGISYREDGNDVTVCGMNAKMNEFQAAMGILGLNIVEKEIEIRKALAQIYIDKLADVEGIDTYAYADGIDYNYAYFPIRIHQKEFGLNRDELFVFLKEKGIITRKLYDVICCDYSCYKNRNYIADVEYARQIAEEALDLPLYGTLLPEEAEYICNMISMIQKEKTNVRYSK